MKLILDEWIVREVIDALYMARTTLLGITGLDSPQDVEKKSANETAITRRISKAIDIIQQSEQSPVPNDLEEAANKFAVFYDQGTCDGIAQDCFIAGAKWNREQMMEESMEWTVTTNLANRPVIYLDDLKGFQYGDKVKIIIVKEN